MSNENQPNIGADYIRFHKVMTRGIAVSLQNINEFLQIGAIEKLNREGSLNMFRVFHQSYMDIIRRKMRRYFLTSKTKYPKYHMND